MLPSPRLIILITMAVPLFLGGALYGPLTVVALGYVAILILYASIDLLSLPRRRRIEISRQVPDRLSLGAPTRIRLYVHNGLRRKASIQVAENVPPEMEACPAQCAAAVEAGRQQALEYRLVAHRRGRFELSAIDVRVLPALGLFYRQFRVDLPAETHVYPNLVNLRRYDLQLRRGFSYEQGLARLRQIGQGTEFESLRPYVQGDEMSRVDWKATAKRSQLIVRNYEPERQQSVVVAIDVGRPTAGEFEGVSRLDHFINATLMLAYVALRQSDWFSLVAFSDRVESYLPPVRHVKNIDQVARALYELRPRLVESDYGAACRFLDLKNRRRSLICLMTDIIDRHVNADIIGYMARFARYHLPLLVTLSDPQVHAAAETPLTPSGDHYSKAAALDVLTARWEALAAMRQRGIGVLDCPPNALTPDLVNRYVAVKSTHRL